VKILKKYWWVILIVVVLLVAIILVARRKQNGSNGQTYRASFPVGRMSHKDGTKVAATFGSPRPPMGSVLAGETIVIEGAGPYNGTYNVSDVWQDASGNLGAVFINVPGTEGMNVGTEVYDYENIGMIHLI